jgi:two-component system, NtrC family, nitrogen regulation sensor histidine kinase GlnL
MPLVPSRPAAPRPRSRPLENVLVSLRDPIILFDARDRVTLFNPAAEELTGIAERHALRQDCATLFAPMPAIPDLVVHTRTSGQSQSRSDELIAAGRRRIPVRVSCSPIYTRRNRLVGTALVIQDLSYQKKLEDDARRNETLARLGGLVAGLAHEIKNPLGGIRGAAQLLARRVADRPEVVEYTGVMIREIDRLNRLVEQLLTLGAPPAPNLQPVNVNRLIYEVLALLETELDAKHMRVRLQIDPSLPDTRGDEAQLTHVLLNLAKNAYEAMPEHGTLTVTTRIETDYHIRRRSGAGRTTGSGQFLRIEVADTGPGFSADVVERAFEPFVTTKARGSGLGLAICERIVAAHGGDIRATNRPTGGAAVLITLPLVPA